MMAYALSILWVLFGIKVNLLWWCGIGFFVSWLTAFVLLFFRKEIRISRYLIGFILFSLLLALSNMWAGFTDVSIRLLVVSLSGVFWWFIGENISGYRWFFPTLKKSLILASVWLILLWVISLVFNLGITFWGADSLVTQSSYYANHNHLGDFMILVIIILLFHSHKFFVPFIFSLLFFRSRSSLLGIELALGYFVFNRNIFRNHKKIIFLSGFVLILLFSALSINKVTLGSRNYYIQSISALTHYPLGVGYGNFSKISNDPLFHPFGLNDYSSYAHSLIFEWVGGVGLVSLLGLLGLLFLMFSFGKRVNKDSSHELLHLLWWAMLPPLLFDTVYVIPTYWWVWMLVTGAILSFRI